MCISGIVFSVVICRYGCRIVTLIGSVVWFVGFGISSLAPNIVVLCFSYGIVAGMFHFLYIFSPHDAMLERYMPSLCVCLSHSDIVSKLLNS